MKNAVCHPNRPHCAKGKCKACYNRELLSVNPAYRSRQRKNARVWTDANKAKKALLDRELHLRRTYGISLEEYAALLDKQGGVCAICKREGGGWALAVDHCHKSATMKIRGLLCISCNRVCGFLDNEEWLAAANKYLGIQGVC